MKLRTKILLVLSAVSILSVAIIGLVGISFGKKTMEREMFEKLTAIRELKANRIEAYFEQIRNQLLSFSDDYMVIDAMKGFQNEFNKLSSSLPEAEQLILEKSLKSYYLNEFMPKLNMNSEESHDLEKFFPTEKQTKLLQYSFISDNKNKTGEKQLLFSSNKVPEYSAVHSHFHPQFKDYLEKFGYYDIFLVDLDGYIIYSVYKEVDFATSLLKGAYNKTNFAEVFKQAANSTSPEFIKMVDFDVYPPSYNGQAAFAATPIFDGQNKIGVLIFQLPIDRINNIMTDNSQWEKVGLGKSGETYLVGEDLLLRNQSRFLIEDKTNYLDKLKEIGTPEDVVSKIDNLNTSIGLQKVETVGVAAALAGDTGISVFPDYRGVNVLSSYRPLTIKDVHWAIMSELDKEEAYSAITGFVKYMVLWLLLLIAMIPLVAWYFSRGLVRPLVQLTNISKEMAAGKLDVTNGLCRKDEIGELACSFDTMSASIKQMMDKLEEANNTLEEKVKLRTKEVELAHYKTQSIIDNANDAIITIDETQKILLFNPAACAIFGYDADEIVGRSLTELLPEAFRMQHQAHIDKFRHEAESSRAMDQRDEIMGMRKSGELFYADVSISRQTIEGGFQYTAFLKDITEKKKAEEQIRISENMFRSISSSASDAIISANHKGIIEFWNDAATDIFGYTKGEVLGESLELIIPEKYHQQHKKGVQRVTTGGKKHIIGKAVEIEGKRKDGQVFPIELSLSNWDGQHGMNFSSIIRDITERKEMELKIEEANKRMEDELNVGRDIQMSMLPLIFPAFPDHSEFNIFALLEPAREVGGDFYDFFFIDEHRFLFSIADVSGKGVPSALFMAVCKTLIKSRASEDASTSSIITHVNEELSRENNSAMFVTLFLCIIDLRTGELSYTNAGHNPPYVKRVSGEIEVLNTLHGPVVGAMEDFAYGEDNIKLNVNDYIILFTDGVNEAMDVDKKLYSDARIIKTLQNDKTDNINGHVQTLFQSVIDFQGDAEQADDITILGFEYLEPLLSQVRHSKMVRLQNRSEEIDRLNVIFEAFCETHEIPPSTYRKFNIVFDELINNIISYAYEDEKDHEIKVKINITEQQLVVSFEDDGIAFNPFNMASPDITASAEDREIGGLGIHIVRNLMDDVSYKRFIKKNMTTLYKNIN